MTGSSSAHHFTKQEFLDYLANLRGEVVPGIPDPPMGERCVSNGPQPDIQMSRPVAQHLFDIAAAAIDAAPADVRYTVPRLES